MLWSSIAFETKFGWVLAGNTNTCTPATHVATHHASLLTGDDILGTGGITHERLRTLPCGTFHRNTRTEAGRFVVPLPKKPYASHPAHKLFKALERMLHAKGQFATDFEKVMFEMEHAEQVPNLDLEKPQEEVFYFQCMLSERSLALQLKSGQSLTRLPSPRQVSH